MKIQHMTPEERDLRARARWVPKLSDIDPSALLHWRNAQQIPHLHRLFVETNRNGGWENDPSSDFRKAFPIREEDTLKGGILYVRISRYRRWEYASGIERYLGARGKELPGLRDKIEYVRRGTSEVVHVPYIGYSSKTLEETMYDDVYYSTRPNSDFRLKGLQKYLWWAFRRPAGSVPRDSKDTLIDYEVIPLIYVGKDEKYGRVMTRALIAMAGLENLSNQVPEGACGFGTSPDNYASFSRSFVDPHDLMTRCKKRIEDKEFEKACCPLIKSEPGVPSSVDTPFRLELTQAHFEELAFQKMHGAA